MLGDLEEIDHALEAGAAGELGRFTDYGKSEPIDQIPVRWEWLVRATRTTSGLWLTDMPSGVLPDVAREGDALICQDVTPPLVDGRIYIFLVHGQPLVRKVQIRPEGLVLRSTDPSVDPITLSADQAEDVIPVGRVVGAIALRSV